MESVFFVLFWLLQHGELWKGTQEVHWTLKPIWFSGQTVWPHHMMDKSPKYLSQQAYKKLKKNTGSIFLYRDPSQNDGWIHLVQ